MQYKHDTEAYVIQVKKILQFYKIYQLSALRSLKHFFFNSSQIKFQMIQFLSNIKMLSNISVYFSVFTLLEKVEYTKKLIIGL